MAKMPMKQIRIVALRAERKKLLEKLQQLGVMEILSEEKSARGFERIDTSGSERVFERNVETANEALKILDKVAPEKKGLLDSFSGRREIELGELSFCAENRTHLMKLCSKIIELYKQCEENDAEAVRLMANIAQLEPWQKLDVPFSFEGTDKTRVFIGSLPAAYQSQTLYDAISERCPDTAFEFEIISSSSSMTCVFVMTHTSNAEQMMKALRSLGFAKPMGANRSLPKDKIERLRSRLNSLPEENKALEDEIASLAEHRQEIESVSDYFRIRADKYKVIGEIDHSKHAVVIKGYVTEQDAERLEKALTDTCTCVVEFSDVNPDEAPVKFSNNAFVSPVESIVEMYAMPNATDIDPTPVMAFFFYFFFGMMFSDAGYGLLMVIATTWALKKFKPEKSMEQSMKLFRNCGIFTMLWGFIYASFFGDILNTVIKSIAGRQIDIPFITKPIIDPVNDSTLLMIISIAFGLIQILVGLGAKFYVLWRQGERFAAIFDCGSWMLLLTGVAVLASGLVLGETFIYIGAGISILSALALVLTQGRSKKGIVMKFFSGIASLYDSTGYISDLMSYTRLLALGLTTAIMGNVFNVLSLQFSGSVWTVIPMILVFIIGHAVNFGLNVLGSYVHSIRLQYVEMFGKFYEGGGKKFEPFELKSKYTRIREENKQ